MKELSLQDIQLESLKILEDIDRVCRQYDVKYCIFFGTLIGAIRHKGFIPWDDDVDIIMTKENYDTFLDIYSKQGSYRIVNYLSEKKCPYMITRISNDDFILKSDFGSNYRIGTFVDIYPFYGIGNTRKEVKQIQKYSTRYSRGLAKSLEKNPVKNIKVLHNGIKKWLIFPQYLIPKLIGPNYYRAKLIKNSERNAYDNSKYVGCAIWYLIDKECFKKEWIEEVIEVEFEGKKVLAPKNYEKVLQHNYGNYMELPPEDMRIAHHYYKIYKK